jgi:hypothetical protein
VADDSSNVLVEGVEELWADDSSSSSLLVGVVRQANCGDGGG